MKTRKEYKDYYLDELIKMFPGLTQADYNSAQEFCYNEEWDLKDTASVEGLNDAWKEYEKRFDEGFEVMNSRIIKSALDENIEQYLSDEKVPIDYFSLFFDWVKVPDYESDEQLKNDIEWFYEDYYISDEDMNKIIANLRKLHEDFNDENGNQKYVFSIDEMDKAEKWISDTLGPDALNVQATKYKGPSIAEQIATMPPEKMDLMYEVVNSRQVKSARRNNIIKSSETMFVDENDPDNPMTKEEMKKYVLQGVAAGEYGSPEDEEYKDYYDNNGNPKWYKIYKDFLDISSNGVFEEITSSRRNNMIKSGYTGTNVSVEYGPYGEEKEFPLYDITGETVEEIDEELGYYDEVKTAWGSDGESYMILQDRANSEDKIAVLEDDYNDWVEAMSNEDYTRVIKSSHAIKSSNGSWEYQTDDMDEVENKIGDIGISFTEPLLLADDGTIYTRIGFNEWLKYLEKEYGDNWDDAYENYHCDSDKEFIEMCSESYFHHDFGHTLTLYKHGLKDIAKSIRKEIPSNKPAFAIPSGFAFELYPEEEEPSGFNSYWIDDLQLNSDTFVWGINPSLGDRFDVVINPDYLWNGNENITSNRRINMKKNINSSRNMEAVAVAENMPGVQKTYDKGSEILVYLENGTDNNAAEKLLKQIMDTLEDEYDNYGFKGNIENHGGKYYIVLEPELTSGCHGKTKDKKKKSIKSGTSNYWNGNATGYDFPLVIYEAENYVYDEETDTETDERDYDADQWEYEDAIANAETLADKFDVELGEQTYKPYTVQIKDGYYAGLQIIIDDTEYDGILIAEDDEEYAQLTEDYPNDYVYTREEFDNMCKEYGDKIMAWLKELVTNYGWQAINVVGHFSNGEGVYEHSNVFNSHKSIKSSVDNDSTMEERAEELGISFDDVLDVFTGYGYGEDEAEDFWNSTFDEIPYETWNDFSELADMFGIEDDKSSVSLEEAVYDGLAEASPHTQDVAIKWFKDEIDLNDFETTDELAEYIRYMAEDFADANPGIRKDLEDCGLIEPEEDEDDEIESSRKPVRSGKELDRKQKDDFIRKAMKKQGYSSSEADTMINQSRK